MVDLWISWFVLCTANGAIFGGVGPNVGRRTREPYPERDKTAVKDDVPMAWAILIFSGILEAVWAISLGKSDGFSKLWPTVTFGIAVVLSMVGLAFAMREISTGTAYAVWVGIGAGLTVAYGMFFGDESISVLKVLLLTGLIACVVGLKFVE